MSRTTDLLASSCFSEVPFHPVPRNDHLVWAGSTETRTELLRIVNEVKHDDVELSHLALVYGEYGSGKTHALKYLKGQLERSSNVISAYLKNPKVDTKASFHAVVKEVIKQIGERPLRSAAEPFVKYLNEESKRLSLEGLDPLAVGGSLDQHVKKRTEEFRWNLKEDLNPDLPELMELFQGLVDEEPGAWRYLTGRPNAADLGRSI